MTSQAEQMPWKCWGGFPEEGPLGRAEGALELPWWRRRRWRGDVQRESAEWW